MPTHGYDRFRGMLLGSVVSKVLHDVDCAVWTAHPRRQSIEKSRTRSTRKLPPGRDAERAREAQRAELDKVIGIGSKVYDFAYGDGEVVKVNKKTYMIKWASGGQFTRDKTYVKPL